MDRRTTASTSDGQFDMAAELEARYVLTAEFEDYPPAVLHGARVSDSVELWIVRYTSALVQVRDPSGRPVVRARVEAVPTDVRGGALLQSDSTDVDGLAELRGLVEGGAHSLVVLSPDSRPELADRRVDGWQLADTDVGLLIRP